MSRANRQWYPAGVTAQELRYEPSIEPVRREVFVTGTERGVVQLAAYGAGAAGKLAAVSGAQPRIASPVPGSIIALDPDIPPRNQRIQFSATGLVTGHTTGRWELDGKVIGCAAEALAWFPWPGAHVLKLVSERGEVLGEAAFEVRGARMKAAAR